MKEKVRSTTGTIKRRTTGTIKKAVDSFQGIIDQKKKAMEETILENEKATRKRQQRLIKALVKIRKSLRDVAKLDMGDRFSLHLVNDDWEGWPRMVLKAIDSQNPTGEHPELVVTSHDRQDNATIEIKYAKRTSPEVISLVDEKKESKVSGILKKCLRDHLEMIGDMVIEIEQLDSNKRLAVFKDDAEKQKAGESEKAGDDLGDLNFSVEA